MPGDNSFRLLDSCPGGTEGNSFPHRDRAQAHFSNSGTPSAGANRPPAPSIYPRALKCGMTADCFLEWIHLVAPAERELNSPRPLPADTKGSCPGAGHWQE